MRYFDYNVSRSKVAGSPLETKLHFEFLAGQLWIDHEQLISKFFTLASDIASDSNNLQGI
jgi:hypothetical protein